MIFPSRSVYQRPPAIGSGVVALVDDGGLDFADATAADRAATANHDDILERRRNPTNHAAHCARPFLSRRVSAILPKDVDAEVDAFVANLNVRSGDDLAPLLLRLVPKRAAEFRRGRLRLLFLEHVRTAQHSSTDGRLARRALGAQA